MELGVCLLTKNHNLNNLYLNVFTIKLRKELLKQEVSRKLRRERADMNYRKQDK